MKKFLSFFIALTVFFTVMSPVASAVGQKAKDITPIVYIRGNGEPIYDENGDEIPVEFADLFNKSIVPEEEGITKDKLIESCANILLPFLAEGLIMDKWDNYGKAIYNEFSPLFEKASLDGDGNPQYSTGVSPMTEENCANFEWLSTAEKNPTLQTKISSLLRFITAILKLLTKLLNGSIVLGGNI